MWNNYKDHPYKLRIPFKKCNLNNFLVLVLLLGTFLTTWNIHNLKNIIFKSTLCDNIESRYYPVKKYAVYGKRVDSGYLSHVFHLLDSFKYKRTNLSEEWDLLWSHDYPFKKLDLKGIEAPRMVNKFPGSGYITNKMNLATTKLNFVPQAFQLPNDVKNLKTFAQNHPALRFVQKSNNHRGVKISKLESLDLTNEKSFVQVYISNPLLIDGYKFDIGLYTILTGINPLRLYIHNEVLFRFCKETYHPFDPDALPKYVVGDDYRPMWEVPSLNKYTKNGFGFKDSFDTYMNSIGKNASKIWSQVESAIRTTYLSKETLLISAGQEYKARFFEMVRFDFVIDEDLNVFLMEANMSPNLSSAHFSQNRLLYEQVLYSIFRLVGLDRKRDDFEASIKHIVVHPEICSKCENCHEEQCKLCLSCLSDKDIDILKETYLEETSKHNCKRIFPIIMEDNATTGLTERNRFLIKWLRAKCNSDISFCMP